MVASEAVPFAKTGGLADVVGALPRALVGLGHDVDVVMPRYRGIDAGERVERMLTVTLGNHAARRRRFVTTDRRRADDLHRPRRLLRPRRSLRRAGPGLRRQPGALRVPVPGGADVGGLDGRRYDVVHAHDWQAGLVPVILSMARSRRRAVACRPCSRSTTSRTRACSTRAGCRGSGSAGTLMRVDAHGVLGPYQLLKAGIVFSRLVTTVSPRYARGDPDAASSGSASTASCASAPAIWSGILNGIDYDQWDPDARSAPPAAVQRRPTGRERRPPSGACSKRSACR